MALHFAGVGLIQFDGPEFPNLMTPRLDVEGASDRLTALLTALQTELPGRGHLRFVLADIRPFRAIRPVPGHVWSAVTQHYLWVCVDPDHPNEFLMAREILPYLHHAHFSRLSDTLDGPKRAAVAEIEHFLLELQFDVMADMEGFGGLEGYHGLREELEPLWHLGAERTFPGPQLLRATLALTRLDAYVERLLDRADLGQADRQTLERDRETRQTRIPRLAAIASAILIGLRRQPEADQQSFRAALEAILTDTAVLGLVGLSAARESGGLQVRGLPGSVGSRGIKVGRNDLCPCGSGRKFKACCGG